MCTKQVALELQNAWEAFENKDDIFVIGAAINKENEEVLKEFRDLHNISYPLSSMNQLGGAYDDFKSKIAVISRDMVLTHKIDAPVVTKPEFLELFEEAINIMYGAPFLKSPIRNYLMGANQEEVSFDLNELFSLNEGDEISYEIEDNGNPNIVSCELNGSIITLSKGAEAGASEIYFTATMNGYDVTNSFEVINANDYLSFDFEGDFGLWQFDGDSDFEISPDGYTGKYCARSGEIVDSESSVMYLECDLDEAGSLIAYLDISSEEGSDKLELIIDDQIKGNWSGERRWFKFSYELEAGHHSIKWRYSKDDIGSVGEDRALIDAMIIPAKDLAISEEIFVEDLELFQNYPNPFNPKTTIKFYNSSLGKVKLSVYNIKGEEVATLVNGKMEKGFKSVDFEASHLNSGIYYYRMETADKTLTKKMVLVK